MTTTIKQGRQILKEIISDSIKQAQSQGLPYIEVELEPRMMRLFIRDKDKITIWTEKRHITVYEENNRLCISLNADLSPDPEKVKSQSRINITMATIFMEVALETRGVKPSDNSSCIIS